MPGRQAHRRPLQLSSARRADRRQLRVRPLPVGRGVPGRPGRRRRARPSAARPQAARHRRSRRAPAGQRPGPRGAHPVHHRVRHLRDGRQGDQARRLRLSAQAVLARRAALRPAQGFDAAHPEPAGPGARRRTAPDPLQLHLGAGPRAQVAAERRPGISEHPARRRPRRRPAHDRALAAAPRRHEEADLRPARPDAHRVGPEAARLQRRRPAGAGDGLDRPAPGRRGRARHQ